MEKHILTINGGSSSIKYALHASIAPFARVAYGRIERIGLLGSQLVLGNTTGEERVTQMEIPDSATAAQVFHAALNEQVDAASIVAVGHRIVHGGSYAKHTRVDSTLIEELSKLATIDPEHMPMQLALLNYFTTNHPALLQVACFDTVFHHDMPRVAQLLPLPRRFANAGMRRFGFHGLSYAYLLEQLSRLDGARASGRIIMLHLGNGASITAIKDGVSIDTSMGYTPAGGIPMSTRSGDIDAGALCAIMELEKLSVADLNHMVNHESGLLGISETSSDMRDLLDSENTDVRAKEAIDLFCYEAKKRVGAYAAALGGVDTVVFSGGMGEQAPRIRARICSGLEFLGITLDHARNEANSERISADGANVTVHVLHTDEELMIAKITSTFIGTSS